MSRNLYGKIDDHNLRLLTLTIALAATAVVWMLAFGLVFALAQIDAPDGSAPIPSSIVR